MSFVAAVLIFGIIIMIHEFGHFLFAKLNGIGVIEFSLAWAPDCTVLRRAERAIPSKYSPLGAPA